MTYSGKLAAGVVLSVSLLMLPAILPGDAPGALASVSHAQAAEPRKERKTRKTPAMREKTYKKLSESRELAEADDFAGALRALDNLSRQRGLNSYELAQMHNFYGFIHFSQENYAQAVRDYENVLAQPNLPLGMETSTIYTLAQLYFTQEDYLGAENQFSHPLAFFPTSSRYSSVRSRKASLSRSVSSRVPIWRRMRNASRCGP